MLAILKVREEDRDLIDKVRDKLEEKGIGLWVSTDNTITELWIGPATFQGRREILSWIEHQ